MEYLSSYNEPINQVLSPLNNPLIGGFLRIFLILYASMVAPHLPDSILQWFQYVPFKIFILFLIVYLSSYPRHEIQPDLAILVSIAFYVSMNVLSGRRAFEAFQGNNRRH
jgi:hypothetical protein